MSTTDLYGVIDKLLEGRSHEELTALREAMATIARTPVQPFEMPTVEYITHTAGVPDALGIGLSEMTGRYLAALIADFFYINFTEWEEDDEALGIRFKMERDLAEPMLWNLLCETDRNLPTGLLNACRAALVYEANDPSDIELSSGLVGRLRTARAAIDELLKVFGEETTDE